ncbi:MAG: hypothetical protein PHS72_05410 [Lachnospiraceae bacterium]|jgi:hypothetical protein|nr:hypothetical protein [Lachnospiraceae bacterium]
MRYNSVNELPHNFGRQFPDIGVPVHYSKKAVGIQQFVLLGADFVSQRGCSCRKLLLFNFIAL